MGQASSGDSDGADSIQSITRRRVDANTIFETNLNVVFYLRAKPELSKIFIEC